MGRAGMELDSTILLGPGWRMDWRCETGSRSPGRRWTMVQEGRMRPEQQWEDRREGGYSGTKRQKLVRAGPSRIIPKTK